MSKIEELKSQIDILQQELQIEMNKEIKIANDKLIEKYNLNQNVGKYYKKEYNDEIEFGKIISITKTNNDMEFSPYYEGCIIYNTVYLSCFNDGMKIYKDGIITIELEKDLNDIVFITEEEFIKEYFNKFVSKQLSNFGIDFQLLKRRAID